ncbi:MAG TPA: AIR synthase-related protein, partial [Candidatus Hydrogenedentes bacterium]|nr:AIR synthase-related protein [Candidatus Hydrogenedentota bacterium]
AFLKNTGRIADLEMLRTFNMGMGFLLVVARDEAEKTLDAIGQTGEQAVLIGSTIEGVNEVNYRGTVQYAE